MTFRFPAAALPQRLVKLGVRISAARPLAVTGLIAAVSVLILGGPARAQSEGIGALTGRVLDIAAAEFIEIPDLVTALEAVPIIVIGERHGHTAHQRRAAFLIGALAERGRYPALALEMLSQDQTSIVDAYRRHNPEYATRLAIPLDWANSGWPDWSYYLPIFEMAFAAKLPILGADATDQDQEENARTLSAMIRRTDPRVAYYEDQMRTAHCNLIDEARATELAYVQIARDMAMAETVAGAARADGAILVVGSAHAHVEVGVPTYLPEGSTSVVALLEVDAALAEAERVEAVADQFTGFDFVWFTPVAGAPAICAQLNRPE